MMAPIQHDQGADKRPATPFCEDSDGEVLLDVSVDSRELLVFAVAEPLWLLPPRCDVLVAVAEPSLL